MILSRLTSKGQTTIPVAVRRALRLRPHDRLVYLIEDEKVTIRPLRGNIFEYKGTVVPKQRPEDFAAVREKVKHEVAGHAARR